MKWNFFFSILIPLFILLILPFLTSEDLTIRPTDKPITEKHYFPVFSQENGIKQPSNTSTEGHAIKKQPKKIDVQTYHWGVDSASVVDAKLLTCTKENYGVPTIWGRYLGTKENVSAGLSKAEVDFMHSRKIKVLLIYNHFVNATGFENGRNEAQQAISLAKKLGVPKGKALFADIEPSYPVDSEFIKGWFDGINQSEYVPGLYGIFDSEKQLIKAYQNAASNIPPIQKETIIWTASPHIGITNKQAHPSFKPLGPKGSNLFGWQYGIEAKTCNIDTNLFSDKLIPYTW